MSCIHLGIHIEKGKLSFFAVRLLLLVKAALNIAANAGLKCDRNDAQ
jgi:hypothetical protein